MASWLLLKLSTMPRCRVAISRNALKTLMVFWLLVKSWFIQRVASIRTAQRSTAHASVSTLPMKSSESRSLAMSIQFWIIVFFSVETHLMWDSYQLKIFQGCYLLNLSFCISINEFRYHIALCLLKNQYVQLSNFLVFLSEIWARKTRNWRPWRPRSRKFVLW